jgi:hypothetical protein
MRTERHVVPQPVPCRFMPAAFVMLTLLLTTAVRAADKVDKIDPSGTWKWKRELEGTNEESVLKLKFDKDKLTGRYARGDFKSDLHNAKLEGVKLSFEIAGKASGFDIKAKFAGKVADDKITGSIEMSANGQSGELDWEAKRGLDLDDVFGKWQLRVETPDGHVFEPTLTLKTDGKEPAGVYATKELGDFKVKDIKIAGRELTYKVSADNDGQTFTVSYVAKPTGDAMKGNVTVEFGGQSAKLDFTGKRIAEEKKDSAETKKKSAEKKPTSDEKKK